MLIGKVLNKSVYFWIAYTIVLVLTQCYQCTVTQCRGNEGEEMSIPLLRSTLVIECLFHLVGYRQWELTHHVLGELV
jgi:hypothetical protein